MFLCCRYLDRYEKVNFLGDDGGRGSDDDDDSRHKRWSARALHSVPLTYNTYQHVLSGECRVVSVRVGPGPRGGGANEQSAPRCAPRCAPNKQCAPAFADFVNRAAETL